METDTYKRPMNYPVRAQDFQGFNRKEDISGKL